MEAGFARLDSKIGENKENEDLAKLLLVPTLETKLEDLKSRVGGLEEEQQNVVENVASVAAENGQATMGALGSLIGKVHGQMAALNGRLSQTEGVLACCPWD